MHTSSEEALVIAVVGDKVGSHAISTSRYAQSKVSKLEITDHSWPRRWIDSRRLSPDCDTIRVPTKCLDMLLHPAHSSTLVPKSKIGISLGLAQCQISQNLNRASMDGFAYPHFLRVQKSKCRQAIIDRDTQHRLAIHRTLLNNIAHIVSAHPQNTSASQSHNRSARSSINQLT